MFATLCKRGIIGAVLAAGITQPALADVTVRFDPPAIAVGVGQQVTMQIVADLTEPVVGWGLDLTISNGAIVTTVGSPVVGPAWIAASAGDGDDLAAIAFPEGVSGTGVVLASVTFSALGLGNAELTLSVTPGDLMEGFPLTPTGFASTSVQSGWLVVLDMGACCYPDGTCDYVLESNCLAAGGAFQGGSASCAGMEACCLADNTCLMVDALCCANQYDGTPQGPGPTCTAPEACCLGDGTCLDIDPACCDGLGGVTQGVGSMCDGLHACCLPDHTCQMLSEACCDDQGGVSSPGEICAATEACCFAGGICEDLNPSCCDYVGGAPAGAPSVCMGDGNGDGIDDACAGDCNGNGIPDECDIDCGLTGAECDIPGCGQFPDCNDNGTLDECELIGNDCNGNAVPDECDLIPPSVDLVFIMDTSESMDEEARALCCDLERAIMALGAYGLDVTPTLLGITETPGGIFDCLTGNVRDQFGSQVPGSPPPCCQTLDTYEDWGPATAIVAAEFPWNDGAVRIIVPISDEAPSHGGVSCHDPGDDRDTLEHAITICNQYDVTASPITGDTSRPCVITLATDLANGTSGTTFQSTDPTADLAGAIIDIVLAAASNDCNLNSTPDECELPPFVPGAPDCNNNGTPDECEVDCQLNGIPDDCDIGVVSSDLDGNGVPDECQDCNINGVFDPDEIDAGTVPDCNENMIPDGCEPDCNGSGFPDRCDIASGTSQDCTQGCGNGIPDECEPDCNANGNADTCDIILGYSHDCDLDGIPNECDIRLADGGFCSVEPCSFDCQPNVVPDQCDVSDGTSPDCNSTDVPDECELVGNDCNYNGVPDECDLADGTSQDCNSTNIPDDCELIGNDCNYNDVPDECDLADGTSEDCNGNSNPDECDVYGNDCNNNGTPDECDVADGTSEDCNGNGLPDPCDITSGRSADCNNNGIPDECQVAIKPGHDLFETAEASHDFAETPVPTGFFGAGSNPFSQLVDLEGLPIETYMGYDVGETDTIVRRLQNAYFYTLVDSDTIPIELVALSLKSVDPIQVTYSNGTPNKFFDLVVTLSPTLPSPGIMTINRTECDGGNYDAALDVVPFFEFTEVDSNPPVQYTLDAASIGYHADVDTSNVPSWERVPTNDQTVVAGLSGDASNMSGAPWLFDFYIFGVIEHVGPHPEIHIYIPPPPPPPPPPPGGGCFLAGTPIRMLGGSFRNIEDVKVGDLVQSYDVKNGKRIPGVVTKTLQHRPDEVPSFYLVIDGKLHVTPNHYLYQNGKWRRADEIEVGDYLDVSAAPVRKIERVFKRVKTYDLIVESPNRRELDDHDGKTGPGAAFVPAAAPVQQNESTLPYYAQQQLVRKWRQTF